MSMQTTDTSVQSSIVVDAPVGLGAGWPQLEPLSDRPPQVQEVRRDLDSLLAGPQPEVPSVRQHRADQIDRGAPR